MKDSYPLPEHLTRRENDILLLLNENLTDREIAERLVLSIHSVKWYVRQVCGKLQVTRRREAVAKAHALNLFSMQAAPKKPEHNLPRQISTFIGREREIAQVVRMVLDHPLVTLCGAGGVGKTRLALHSARELIDAFPDGVWWVDLASVVDPVFVPIAVARTFNLHSAPGERLVQTLRQYLAFKGLLLIFDNCEHVIEPVAELSTSLLESCPKLSILVTSREILNIVGEDIFRCPTLSLPDLSSAQPSTPVLKRAEISEAVQLFVERAAAASPGFCLTDKNAADIMKICQCLDGIPLAIELAAARLRLLSLEQITDHLNDVFCLLTYGSRTALPRHKTLRALIDWSYDLLPSEEQALFQELSVFTGGWTLEAAEAVCSGENVLDRLERLIDKSLVTLPDGEKRRFTMLDTVRQYGEMKLQDSGGTTRRREAHLKYYLCLAERLEPGLGGVTQIKCLDLLEQDLANIRAALSWALQTDLEAELRLSSALMWFWHSHNHAIEGLIWLEEGLARAENSNVSAETRAKTLTAAGFHTLHRMARAVSHDRMEELLLRLKESLQIYRGLGEKGKSGAAFTLWCLGMFEVLSENYLQSLMYSEESLAIYRENGDLLSQSYCLFALSLCHWFQDIGSKKARLLLEECLAIRLQLRDTDGIATAYRYFGNYSFAESDIQSARDFYQRSLEFFLAVGNQIAVGELYERLSTIANMEGCYTEAQERIHQSIDIHHRAGNSSGAFWSILYEGRIHLVHGMNQKARSTLDEAMSYALQTGNSGYIGLATFSLGVLAWVEGNRQAADESFEKAFHHFSVHGMQSNIAYYQANKGRLLCLGSKKMEGKALMKEALQFFAEKKNYREVSFLIDGIACMEATDQPERAAKLFGASLRLFPYLLSSLLPAERADREAALANVRASIRDEQIDGLLSEIGEMSLNEALVYALENIEE